MGLSTDTERAPYVDLFVEAGFDLGEARAASHRMRDASASAFEVAGLVQLEVGTKTFVGGVARPRATVTSIAEAASRIGDDGDVVASGWDKPGERRRTGTVSITEGEDAFWADIDRRIGIEGRPTKTPFGRPIVESTPTTPFGRPITETKPTTGTAPTKPTEVVENDAAYWDGIDKRLGINRTGK